MPFTLTIQYMIGSIARTSNVLEYSLKLDWVIGANSSMSSFLILQLKPIRQDMDAAPVST